MSLLEQKQMHFVDRYRTYYIYNSKMVKAMYYNNVWVTICRYRLLAQILFQQFSFGFVSFNINY